MTPSEKPNQKPNLILLMADQHRGDAIGCSGNRAIKTPNIDSLAKDGVYFPNAYTAVPSCTPARAGLLTGLSPWHHGMLGYAYVAEHYKYEMPQMIRKAGYYTFGIGKMHWHPQRTLHGFHDTLLDESGRQEETSFVSDYRQWFRRVAPGKDPDETGIGWNSNKFGKYALDEKLHPTYWTGDQAVKKIKEHDFEEPLYLKVSFARPHSPYDAPARFANMYNWRDMPAPYKGDWLDIFSSYKRKKMRKSPFFGDFGVEHAKKARKYYYGNVTFIDEQIGRILQALNEKGEYDNSLIIYTADHGDMLGDHDHWRKTYAFEGSANIPMVLRWPTNFQSKVKRGSILDYPTELRDVLPTFLDATDQQIPPDMDGDSLLKLIEEERPKWREYIDFEHATCYHRNNNWIGLTDGKMKYVFLRSLGEELLFDLKKDPKEEHNYAGDEDYQDELKIWRSRMREHLSERGRKWIRRGKIRKRKRTIMFSPNFPAS